MIWQETFATPASAKDFTSVYPLKTRYDHATQKCAGEAWPDGSLVTHEQEASSRVTGSFTANVMVDGRYMPNAYGPRVANGLCYLEAWKLPAGDAAKFGGVGKRQWAGAMISTSDCFRFTYGEIELRWLIGGMQGAWDGLSLYSEEGGINDEIDIEHYGAPINGDDRRGFPFTTVHPKGQAPISNANSYAARKVGTVDTRQWVVNRLIWTPDYIISNTNGVETFRTPNPGIHSPHYLVVGRDVDPRQNPTGGGHLVIDYIKVTT